MSVSEIVQIVVLNMFLATRVMRSKASLKRRVQKAQGRARHVHAPLRVSAALKCLAPVRELDDFPRTLAGSQRAPIARTHRHLKREQAVSKLNQPKLNPPGRLDKSRLEREANGARTLGAKLENPSIQVEDAPYSPSKVIRARHLTPSRPSGPSCRGPANNKSSTDHVGVQPARS